jgi:hypothetical protein
MVSTASSRRFSLDELCTCATYGGKLHRKRPKCRPMPRLDDSDDCPHGADDPLRCPDCRRRRYYDRYQ